MNSVLATNIIFIECNEWPHSSYSADVGFYCMADAVLPNKDR